MLALYGLQLHHLTLSGVLHLSCFVTLCECFLGVRPRFGLFRYFFEVVPYLKDDRIPSYGGAIIRPRLGSNYFDLTAATELESWKWGWFYAPNNSFDPDDPGLPEFTDEPCWQVDFDPGTGLLIEAIARLQEKGLSGLQILKTWVERNIQPLGQTDPPMYGYRGRCNPKRLLWRDLTAEEVEDRLRLLIGLPLEELQVKVAIEPYSLANP